MTILLVSRELPATREPLMDIATGIVLGTPPSSLSLLISIISSYLMVWLVVGVASVSGAAEMQIKILFQPCLDKAGAAVGFNVCMYCTVRRSLVSSTGPDI